MSEQNHKFQVADRLTGERLDVGLTIAGVTLSRSQAQKLIQSQKVLVNQKLEKSSYKLQLGDSIEVEIPEKKSVELIPYDFPIDVVFEDDHVIVVNKPAGLVVHPAYGHESDTLINALLFRKTQLSKNQDDEFRPGLVHRIDKGTSGLLVLAKTEEAHHSLAKQFERKSIHRIYWALCFFHKNIQNGTIRSNLTRDPNNRQRFMVCEEGKGKSAVTHFRVLSENKPFRLYQLKLETGRTHQIRVHLSSEQNPIVGDEVYGGKNVAKNLKNLTLRKIILDMNRFALHAKELGFVHPETKKEMKFTSKVPDDLSLLYEKAGMDHFI